jgi:hypothetical protein
LIADVNSCETTTVKVNKNGQRGVGAGFGWTGSVTKGAGEVKAGFGSNCSTKPTIDEKFTAVGSGDFWLQPDFYAFMSSPDSQKAEVICFK